MIFVILYVWQNVHVMNLKIEYDKIIHIENRLIKENDRLRYELAKMKRFDLIEKYALREGLKRITASDLDVIDLRRLEKTRAESNSQK